MTVRKPLVLVGGQPTQLPNGDTIDTGGGSSVEKIAFRVAARVGTSGTDTQGMVVTVTSGSSSGVASSSGSFVGSIPRINIQTATTGASAVGLSGTQKLPYSNTGSFGGFELSITFAISDGSPVPATPATFIGVNTESAVSTSAPETMTNCIGMAQLRTDATQMYIVSGGSTANAPIPLGSSDFPAGNSGNVYRFSIKNPRGSGRFDWEAKNLNTGVTSSGSITIAMPTNPTLSWHCGRSVAAATNAATISFTNLEGCYLLG